MSSLADSYPTKLDFGRVAQETFRLIGRRPLAYFGLALVFAGGLSVLSNSLRLDGWPVGDSFLLRHHGPGLLLSLLLSAFLQGCLLHLGFSEMAERRAELREVLAAGAKFFLPLFAVKLVYWLVVCCGLVLLVFPGVMIGLAWLLAAPVLLAERGELMGAFGRSAELTRDNRWRLLGLVAIWALGAAALSTVLSGGGFYRFDLFDMLDTPRWVATRAIVATVSSAVLYAGLAAAYAQLRQLKEGVPPADLLAPAP